MTIACSVLLMSAWPDWLPKAECPDENMKSVFVFNVSHEFRTPLTWIRASLRLMAGPLKADLSDRVERLVTIADRNAENLLKLVSDLLDLDKIESGKMTFDFATVDLNMIGDVSAGRSYSCMYTFLSRRNSSMPARPPSRP